ncbi:MAG: hypothetical protein GX448_07340 [Planctomycetes bacterium]|nr:hypothetical protein [Planctomycetota bacterium]
MDALEALAKLALKAREETTPVFGVADQVRLRIRSEKPMSVTLIPLGLFGGISAVAASVTLFLAIEFWKYMSSPVMELIAPLPEMRLW